MTELSKENFNAAIMGGKDLILYVHRPNQAESMITMQAILEVDALVGRTFDICLINADQNPEILCALSVSDIPETISIKNKKIYRRQHGLIHPNEIVSLIK